MSSVFNDSEGLYRKTVCRCLVHRPHYSARLMLFGSRGPSEFFLRYATEMPGTGHGNVYLRVREKQGTSFTNSDIIWVLFHYYFEDTTSCAVLKIANFNPQQEARFMLWKKLIPRESGGDGV